MFISARQSVTGSDYRTAVWAYYRYYPSLAAAVIFVVLFALSTFAHVFQLVHRRAWFFIPFVIGGFFEWVGYIGRALSSQESPNWTMGPYIQQTILLLVAPALFAASIYMMLGKIIVLLEAEDLSFFKKRWLTKFFVCGDILSFSVQAAGGGIMAGGSLSAVHNGEKIVIAGLVIQIVFFGFFIITTAVFHTRLLHLPTERSMSLDIWRTHMTVLYITSILIMVRSVFRVVEYAMGNNGYLLRHEAFMYVFDGVLMLAVMVVFNIVHPGKLSQPPLVTHEKRRKRTRKHRHEAV
ncbi:RTA1 like protein-domain-containing protein [Aspergillus alliaceus]|uniref:RTA1 like protein-domain-containing protein n=1 Tax=Petromyces alliaceus TaxID=209559 RepID=A0A5N7C7P9_PETAA|nr:RTA1 like protein-domain-containing protein [Aspergillus alliaceus]